MIAVLALGAGNGGGLRRHAGPAVPAALVSGRSPGRSLPRRVLMTVAEVLRALALLTLPILAAFELFSVPVLAVLGFAAATGTVVFSVAAPALVPSLVPREMLARANGALELARSLAFAAGPALAGALVGWAGASQTFMLAAALSVWLPCS